MAAPSGAINPRPADLRNARQQSAVECALMCHKPGNSRLADDNDAWLLLSQQQQPGIDGAPSGAGNRPQGDVGRTKGSAPAVSLRS
jgi:hypothetical protein